jgi:dienelactone hydrolase
LTWQVPASNTDTDSVAAVGSYPSLGWTGTYDMLGNVREWCFNALGGNQRTIVGGAWDTLPYMVQHSITYSTALPAFDRSPQNGMRLATLNDDRTARAVLRRPIKPATPIEVVPAATDDVFEAFVRNFEQGDTALRATIEGETPISDWTRQKITFDRGDGERVGLYLYLPDTDASRYPAVVYWPSAMAFNQDSPPENMHLDFLVRRGWAVALVVLERTFDRRLVPAVALDAVAYRDVMIRRVRELRRTIDYLETRPDIDTASLAYYGLSWGGFVAPLPLVAEPRLKVAILNQTGVVENLPYDIDTAHYLPRVRQPVLQFNGRYDTDFRYEDSALPFFELLGSEHKKHVVEPTGHFVAVSTVIGETLAWLDTHVPR